MKTLLLDVECTPNLATVWGIWQQNIAINQLHETSRVMCFSAKWVNGKEVRFESEYEQSHIDMVEKLHGLLSEADAVVHYNGNKFDMPVINREFLRYSYSPPAPYKNIDLLEVVKRQFRFVSNKLDHVVQELGIGGKVETGGHELWLKCMDGDPNAWKTMEEYNKHDVILLEALYYRLLPWIHNHPNPTLYTKNEDIVCPTCGSVHLQKRGTAHGKSFKYQRYQCMNCGAWSRGRHTINDKEESKKILVNYGN